MLGAPGALEALGDLLLAGADAGVAHGCEHMAVPLPGINGPQDAQAGFSGHVGNDVGKLQIHLGERLLHVLDGPGLGSEQGLPLASQGAQNTDLFTRAESSTQQAIGHQLLQPLGSPGRRISGRTRSWTWRALTKRNLEAPGLQEFETGESSRTPVDSMATTSTLQAASQSASACNPPVKLENSRTGSSSRSGGTATKWLALPMSIPAALGWVITRLGRGFTQLGLGFGLECAHVSSAARMEGAVPHRERRYAHSPKRDIGHADKLSESRFTNVDDVTQDHANPRAKAPMANRSSAAPTTP